MRLFIVALWPPAGKGLTFWLSFVMSYCEFVTFPIGILGQLWYLIVSIPDLCPLRTLENTILSIILVTYDRLKCNLNSAGSNSDNVTLKMSQGPPGFTCWICFAPVFSSIYC